MPPRWCPGRRCGAARSRDHSCRRRCPGWGWGPSRSRRHGRRLRLRSRRCLRGSRSRLPRCRLRLRCRPPRRKRGRFHPLCGRHLRRFRPLPEGPRPGGTARHQG
ncbi:hypothetical protein DX903_09365 [Adlercreutzia equolifaciens]|nr:hypothetical protein DX903_09365 [Adlercreutzia equolifaciens]